MRQANEAVKRKACAVHRNTVEMHWTVQDLYMRITSKRRWYLEPYPVSKRREGNRVQIIIKRGRRISLLFYFAHNCAHLRTFAHYLPPLPAHKAIWCNRKVHPFYTGCGIQPCCFAERRPWQAGICLQSPVIRFHGVFILRCKCAKKMEWLIRWINATGLAGVVCHKLHSNL